MVGKGFRSSLIRFAAFCTFVKWMAVSDHFYLLHESVIISNC